MSAMQPSKLKRTMKKVELNENEYYRVNSYYWFGMVYIALEVQGDKTLCQIKGGKNKPKLVPTKHLSKIQEPLESFN